MPIDYSILLCFVTGGNLGRVFNLNQAGESYKDISYEVGTLLVEFWVPKSARSHTNNYIMLMLCAKMYSLGLLEVISQNF